MAQVHEPRTAEGQLRSHTTAMSVSFTWWGNRKALSDEQKEEAAAVFGANAKLLSAGKRLVDAKHPAVSAVNAVKSRIVKYWKAVTLPFPEPGLRVVKRHDIPEIDARLHIFRGELALAVSELQNLYDDVLQQAHQLLRDLYNPSDYPLAVTDLFAVTWEYPNVDPPSYLRQLSPEIYAAQCRVVEARFQEAVLQAEQAFVSQFAELLDSLMQRLTGEGHERKMFKADSADRLREWFRSFRHLNVTSSEQLEALVDRAERIVAGIEQPRTLNQSTALQQQLATQFAGVQSVLDGMLVNAPRRRLNRARS